MTSSVPRVSVVIPNYNHARFLDRRIGSVLGQTLSDIEVLLLDDASTDESLSVFARYAGDTRVRTVLNASNSGSPFAQWNRGVSEARGEYVWIAESDDWADPRLLETLARRLDENPDAGIAYCQSWQATEEDERSKTMQFWTPQWDRERWRRDFINSGPDECRRFLIIMNTIPNASAVVFRRSVYERVGGADTDWRAAGDWLTWVKMLLISDVAFVAEPLNYFRWHSNGVTRKSLSNGLLTFESYQIIARIAAATDASPDMVDLACRDAFQVWMLSTPLAPLRRTSWETHLRIYRQARRVDSRLHRRLIRHLWDRLALITKVRRLLIRGGADQ